MTKHIEEDKVMVVLYRVGLAVAAALVIAVVAGLGWLIAHAVAGR